MNVCYRQIVVSVLLFSVCDIASGQLTSFSIDGEPVRFNNAERIPATAATTTVVVKIQKPDGFDVVLKVDPATATAADNNNGTWTVTVKEPDYNRNIRLDIYTEKDGMTQFDRSGLIYVDSRKPSLQTPVAERFPGGSGTVKIPLADNDLDPSSVSSASTFTVLEQFVRNDGQLSFSPVTQDGDPTISDHNRLIILNFRNLNPGSYWLGYTGIKDVVGNQIAAASIASNGTKTGRVLPFTVLGSRVRGEQVEFPRFLRPGDEQDEFNPGDRVDTRVVQLYYFRDGRRVAELINRNVQNLNQQGYDQAQMFAEKARRSAEDRIDERRFKETLAVDSARRTRELQERLVQAQADLEEALTQKESLQTRENRIRSGLSNPNASDAQITANITDLQNQLTTLDQQIQADQALVAELPQRQRALAAAEIAYKNANAADKAARQADLNTAQTSVDEATAAQQDLPAKLAQRRNLANRLVAERTLQTQLTINAAAVSRLDGKITALQAELSADKLPQQLADQQQQEIDDRQSVVKAEASELRAAQEQFRREVAAGLADPDTYARGRIQSIDPITQVSISVVGTSRLQLRGPITGINKICRMIHQIDSPVGQVKVGIHTVQVNGEHGDRMDFVYEKINKEIAHSRFLVNTSGRLLRRAVSEVAAEVALAADNGYLPDGCPPDLTAGVVTINGSGQTTRDQRDRRYLYAFFGSDFISELEEMDSELLNTENKMLSLNSMDTISLAGAMSVTALADAPVRERIIRRVQELLCTVLPDQEVKYVQALTHVNECGQTFTGRFRRALRVDSRNAKDIYFNASRTYHFPNTITFFTERIPGQGVMNPVQYATVKLAQTLKAQLVAELELNNLVLERSLLETRKDEIEDNFRTQLKNAKLAHVAAQSAFQKLVGQTVKALRSVIADALKDPAVRSHPEAQQILRSLEDTRNSNSLATVIAQTAVDKVRMDSKPFAMYVLSTPIVTVLGYDPDVEANPPALETVATAVTRGLDRSNSALRQSARLLQTATWSYMAAKEALDKANQDAESARKMLFSKRLLDQFIDEQEEKSVELMEALRSHSSNVDNYLKRLAIAMEDDVAAQFYEPAFQRIRRVSRTWDVTLGQIESTTILTNNRTLAKVSPAATFEFDLPHREILLTEAMKGTKALADEYGNLLKDGTFLAGTSMLSGQPATGMIGSNVPVQSIPGLESNQQFGSDLQKLIPKPEIYKFETGTGFEIRPVIQPDGHSIVYTFDYLYSTNVREPVRADEKHLGRVKRHFVHTDVQTSSYELREISRYTVALKASRTERGVPLFEDIPGVGALFRPLPSAESALQTNIILGSSVIYPTVFDLMGLRWSEYVDELGSETLARSKDSQTNRREELRSHLLRTTTGTVNQTIGLPNVRYPAENNARPGIIRLP